MIPNPPTIDFVLSWLRSSTVQVSVLIALVLAVRWIFRARLAPRWRHLLWLVVIARMLIPFSVEIKLPWLDPRPAIAAHLGGGEGNLPQFEAGARSETPARPAEARVDFSRAVFLLWLAGMILLAGRLGWESLRFARRVAGERPMDDAELRALLRAAREEMGVRAPVEIVVTSLVSTPMLCGYFRPRILLPEGARADFSDAELRFIILHELAHLKRHDIAINWAASLLQIVHWFNPLVWAAFRQMRADREEACDALVLSRARPEENIPYGETIVKLLGHFRTRSPLPGLAGILEYRRQIKDRVTMIRDFRPGRERFAAAAVLTCVLALFAFTLPSAFTAGTSSDEKLPVAAVLGPWVNTEPTAKSLARIVLSEESGQLYLDGWDKPLENPRNHSRIALPLSPAEFLSRKTFTATVDRGYATAEYHGRFDGSLFVLSQRTVYRDPERAPTQGRALYVREGTAAAPLPRKGLLGTWSNMFPATRYYREVKIRAGDDGVFLVTPSEAIPLPLSRSAAEDFGDGSLEMNPLRLPGEFTVALKGRVLTIKGKGNWGAFEEKYLAD